MNLKNLFGGKKNEESIDAKHLEELVDSQPEAREQHYIFAHYLLRSLAFHMGATIVLILADANRSNEFLQEVWRDAGKDLSSEERIAYDGLKASVTRLGEKLVAVITMPVASAVTEAHCIAIVSDLPPDAPNDDSSTSRDAFRAQMRAVPLDYYTLEYGFTLDATKRTVFCRWTREGAHQNMGDGPEPTEEALLDFLASGTLPSVKGSFTPPAD